MRVLLFGSSGFLGRSVGRQLTAAGDEVTHVRRPGSAAAPHGETSLEMALDRVDPVPEPGPHDAAIFLAQSARYRDWPEGAPDMLAVNVLGVARALELARRAGVRRFLYASTGSIYARSDSPLDENAPLEGVGFYALSKRLGEQVVDAFGEWMEPLCVRPFAIYGPGQRGRMVHDVVAAVAAGQPVWLEPRHAGEAQPTGFTTSPIFVEDAAHAIRELLVGDVRGAVNLAGPEAVSVRGLAEAAGRALGREPVFEVADRVRSGDLVADVTRLRKWVSLEFTSLEEGVRRVLEADVADAG